MLVHLAALAVAVQADTVTLSAAEYLERVVARGPGVTAAALRADAASHDARQAGAWTNPDLAVTVDNVGAQTEVTGLSGAEGLEGQAVFTFALPLGGDRGARLERGLGLADEASALAVAARLDAVADAVAALARAQRESRIAEGVGEELDAMEALAAALDAQAARGRAAEADAARARLETTTVRESWARARAAADAALVDVARRGGFAVDEPVAITPGACGPPPDDGGGGSPRIAAAEARVRAARGNEAVAGAERIPDVRPEIGLRRTMGVEALYAGLAVALPFFDRGSRRVQGARAATAAALADADDERRRVEAETAAAHRAFAALDAVRADFAAPGWDADLERVVDAARVRLQLGEGTLAELLDARRARLRALEARERWAADWRTARARLAALQGREPTSDLLCDPLTRENR